MVAFASEVARSLELIDAPGAMRLFPLLLGDPNTHGVMFYPSASKAVVCLVKKFPIMLEARMFQLLLPGSPMVLLCGGMAAKVAKKVLGSPDGMNVTLLTFRPGDKEKLQAVLRSLGAKC